MVRLTDQQRRDRALSEDEFRAQVLDLATMLGWTYMTVGPLWTTHGWRTPTRGPLGEGWPDLVLVRVRDKRLLFVELKRELGRTTPEQDVVLATLTRLGGGSSEIGLDTAVWRPSDIERVTEVLR